MTATTVGDLFARERRTDRPALEDAAGRTYDAHWLCTSTWKAGNFLRHSGVREGVAVGVVGSGPMALLSFFGTALLEGTTRFDPPRNLVDDGDSAVAPDGTAYRTVVAPTASVGDYRLPTGGQRIGYGEKPDDPAVHHLDTGLWSENPSFPPIDTDPDTAVLTDGNRTITHGDLLESARDVVEANALETGDRVVVRAPLSDPRTVAAGVIAPLLADGVCVLSSSSDETDADGLTGERGVYAISSENRESTPEPRRIALETVSI
ncbi:hypothetical protein [Halostagnicola kamekurae]|uniref:Acetyl-CoA synthetase n=1 Tax=Halostagnicola kamekurae TaxID=619731 RepID=A0A1I6Q9V9_9EURY|nr:hypothetical protein [Halostagnicola kamekurae]SFS49239.1 hypothetical protein SAMN04488556_1107 [Halostagnicola kamekurae]